MFRKFLNSILVIVGLTLGLNFHFKELEPVYATSLEITGKIGDDQEKHISYQEKLTNVKTEDELAKPKEAKIYLQKHPALGERRSYFFLFGLFLLSMVYFLKKRNRKRMGI